MIKYRADTIWNRVEQREIIRETKCKVILPKTYYDGRHQTEMKNTKDWYAWFDTADLAFEWLEFKLYKELEGLQERIGTIEEKLKVLDTRWIKGNPDKK